MRRHRAAATAAAALLTLAATACGGGNDGPPAATEPPADNADTDTAALETSVRAYTKALFEPDPDTAYDLLSSRCQDEISPADYAMQSESAHHEYGQLTIEDVTVDQLAGDMARVSYSVGVPALEREAQPWTREDGTWRWDAC